MTITDELLTRGFDPTKYKCWIDDEKYCMTVPLYSFDGRLVGTQRYAPKFSKKNTTKTGNSHKYYTYTTEFGIWGLDTIPLEPCTIFVTEAVFRSTALHSIGLNSISILGSSIPTGNMNDFKIDYKYRYVWIGDPDSGGMNKNIIKGFYELLQSPKDLDEMSLDELIEFRDNVLVNYI